MAGTAYTSLPSHEGAAGGNSAGQAAPAEGEQQVLLAKEGELPLRLGGEYHRVDC